MKRYTNVKRIVGGIAMLVLFFTGSVYAQLSNVRYTSNGSKPLDITMVSSMVLQPAWLTTSSTTSNVTVVRTITTEEQFLAGAEGLSINNRVANGRGINCDRSKGALALAPPESRNSDHYWVGMVYADVDDDMTTFQSSVAFLDFGTASCIKIEKAFLYWTGYSNQTVTYAPYNTFHSTYPQLSQTFKSYAGGAIENDKEAMANVLFKPTGATAYIPLTGTLVSPDGENNITFVADVTDYIEGGASGLYTVANVRSGASDTNASTGWSLVVIYSSPSSPPRSILLVDVAGQGSLPGNNGTISINLTESPATNNSLSYLGFIGRDSEDYAGYLDCPGGSKGPQNTVLRVQSNNGGTQLTFQQFTDQPRLFGIMRGQHGDGAPCSGGTYDGAISSTLTTYSPSNGLNGNQLARLPDTRYTLGYDAHHIKLPNGAVTQGATEVTFTLPEEQNGNWSCPMAYLAIETLRPVLTIDKAIVPGLSNLTIDPSELEKTEITYRIGVANKTSTDLGGGTFTGTAIVTDPLPDGLDLINESGVDKIKVYFFDENGNWPASISQTNPNVCYRYDAATHTVTVENHETLPLNYGFYVDIFTRLKPYSNPVWAYSCNRVIKNVATLNFGESHNPMSNSCNPDVDLDASDAIDLEWDVQERAIINVQIEAGNKIVNEINADSRLASLGGGFEIFRCVSIGAGGDCFNDIAGLSPLTNENYDGTPNQFFIAYKTDGTVGLNGKPCCRVFIVRPVPPSPDFKVEATKAVSCAAGQGIDNDGVGRVLVNTKRQNATFNYELRNAAGNPIAGFSGSKTMNSDDFAEISSFSGLPAGTYYVYISGLIYQDIPASVVRAGYVAADGTLQPALNATANAPVKIEITAPAALPVPAITVNQASAPAGYPTLAQNQRCLNYPNQGINLSASAAGATEVTYQWFDKSNSAVSGATNSTYSTAPTESGQLSYTVEVRKGTCTSTRSNPAAIDIRNVPNFTITGLDRTFCSSEGTAKALVTSPTAGVTYNWTSANHGNHTGTEWDLQTNQDDNAINVTGIQEFCQNKAATVALDVELQITGVTIVANPANEPDYKIGDVITLTAGVTGGEPSLVYSWTADGTPIASNGATIQVTLNKLKTVYEVTVRNAGGVCGSKTAEKVLNVCQAKFSLTPKDVKRCSNNTDPLVISAITDPQSSPIYQYVLVLEYDGGKSSETITQSGDNGIFTLQPSQLENIKKATVTAAPECDHARTVAQSVNIKVYPEIRITNLLVNGTPNGSGSAAYDLNLGELLTIEVSPYDPTQHLYIINNDIWTKGNIYEDYPLNDKSYLVVLTTTDPDRICSDEQIVNVKIKALPTAILSTENTHFNPATPENSIISVVGTWQVFNRYGQEVFSTSGDVIWAGQNKDEKQLSPGTYFYIYTTPNNQVKKGTIEVVK